MAGLPRRSALANNSQHRLVLRLLIVRHPILSDCKGEQANPHRFQACISLLSECILRSSSCPRLAGDVPSCGIGQQTISGIFRDHIEECLFSIIFSGSFMQELLQHLSQLVSWKVLLVGVALFLMRLIFLTALEKTNPAHNVDYWKRCSREMFSLRSYSSSLSFR